MYASRGFEGGTRLSAWPRLSVKMGTGLSVTHLRTLLSPCVGLTHSQ